MHECFACVCVCICVCLVQSQKRESQIVVNLHAGTGNQGPGPLQEHQALFPAPLLRCILWSQEGEESLFLWTCFLVMTLDYLWMVPSWILKLFLSFDTMSFPLWRFSLKENKGWSSYIWSMCVCVFDTLYIKFLEYKFLELIRKNGAS